MWTSCGKGHDLTVEDAFVYGMTGNRRCRVCVQEETGKRPPKQPKLDTWHEKIQRSRGTFA